MNENTLKTDLEKYFDADLEAANENELREKLTKHIQYLIDYNLNMLYAVLYRIDVNEKKVKNIIAAFPYASHAAEIAKAIMERQKEKIISRKNH